MNSVLTIFPDRERFLSTNHMKLFNKSRENKYTRSKNHMKLGK